jgi:predicted transcriptional regulator of viral defense system
VQTNLRTLGPKEAKLVLSLREEGQEVVSAADIIARLRSEPTARTVIQSLLRKGWLTRLVPGRYMFLPPEHGPEALGENNMLALASAAVEPSYVGWWSAASFHGFTTQKPQTVTVAVTRQVAAREIEGTEVRFVSVTARKFFGFQPYELFGRTVHLSTPAKTIVDCLDRPDLCGGASELARILFGASTVVPFDQLLAAATQMGSGTVFKRMGYLTDLVGWQISPSERDAIKRGFTKSTRSTLGRQKRLSGDVGYVADWGLFVNIAHDALFADIPRRVRPITC